MPKPRVLLTNDDGPPNPKDSPYVLGLYRYLTEQMKWDVKVVLPSSQRSWIGKAYHIKETTKGFYFYPKEDGTGETSLVSRSLKPGEIVGDLSALSIFLPSQILPAFPQGSIYPKTPATCVNVAMYNLFPDQFDLVVSGPNLGRNTSAAFALSSGTIGAALSSSLAKVRSIALSYGTVLYPTPTTLFQPAHRLGALIVAHLWENWGKDQHGLRNGEVDLYSINIPLGENLLTDEGPKICSTFMWRNSYGRLFQRASASVAKSANSALAPGPDASGLTQSNTPPVGTPDSAGELMFSFSPDMTDLITPSFSSLPVGSDAWALHQGWVSVTPLRASFGEPDNDQEMDGKIWKLKL
ncbi:hypothetical protein H0H93_002937 [Arthromyces matolae]|nr:hypothetical protein H0H93_002937 [Arthromyces matolae]